MSPTERTPSLPPGLRVVVWRVVAGNILCFCCGVAVAAVLWAPLALAIVVAAGVGFLLGLGFAVWLTVEFG